MNQVDQILQDPTLTISEKLQAIVNFADTSLTYCFQQEQLLEQQHELMIANLAVVKTLKQTPEVIAVCKVTNETIQNIDETLKEMRESITRLTGIKQRALVQLNLN